MVAMWHRLGALFGAAWESQYGTVKDGTMRAWLDALRAFNAEQIGRGIKGCEDWKKDFPPNLPQFKELCLTVKRDKPNFTERRIEQEKAATLKSLAAPAKGDSELVKHEKEKIRKYLAGEDDPFNGQTEKEARHAINHYLNKQRQAGRL